MSNQMKITREKLMQLSKEELVEELLGALRIVVDLKSAKPAIMSPGAPQSPSEPTVKEVIAWLEKRPGISWKQTINDLNYALQDLALALSRPNRETESGR